MDRCTVNNGYLAFGKTMIVEFKNCDFNDGAELRCYGPILVENSKFEADCKIGATSLAAVDIAITLNNCSVDGNRDVKDVCCFFGNSNGVEMTFVIDGETFEAESFSTDN